MIDDERRHEVAENLRKQLMCMREDDSYEKDSDVVECGNFAYRNIAGSVEPYGNYEKANYVHIVELLTDLIDRPICKTIIKRELHTAFGKPITKLNVYVLSCGHQAIGFEKPEHCPKCGAVVVDED